MKKKQTATILSIDDLNKSFEVKITNCLTALEDSADSDTLLPLEKEKLSVFFEIGDVIEFKQLGKSCFEIVNLTC
jgi:hypothetical protein